MSQATQDKDAENLMGNKQSSSKPKQSCETKPKLVSKSGKTPSLDGADTPSSPPSPYCGKDSLSPKPIQENECKPDKFVSVNNRCQIFEDESKCIKHSVKILNIKPNKFIEFCNLMDIEHTLGGDWRSLAGKLGYNTMNVLVFEKKSSPTKSLMKDWNGENQHSAEDLVEILRQMRRDDAGDLIEKEIERISKEEQCNCHGCGHLG